MKAPDVKITVRLVGILAILFLLYSVWMGKMRSAELPGGYESPVLALELVKSGADIDLINKADGGRARAFIRSNVYKDFGLAFLYVLTFGSLSLVLARITSPKSKWIGWTATIFIVLAGFLDLLENSRMQEAIALTQGATDSLAQAIRYSSLAKWTALYLFALFVGVVLFTRSGWLLGIGLCFLATAVIGLSGVIFNLLDPRFYWMFPTSLLTIGLATFLTALQFTLVPSEVLDQFPAYPRDFDQL